MLSCWVESIPGAPERGSLTFPLVPSTPASNCIALCRTLGLRRMQFGNQYSRIKCKTLKWHTHALHNDLTTICLFQIHFVAGEGLFIFIFATVQIFHATAVLKYMLSPHRCSLSHIHTHILFFCFHVLWSFPNLQPKINFLIPIPFFSSWLTYSFFQIQLRHQLLQEVFSETSSTNFRLDRCHSGWSHNVHIYIYIDRYTHIYVYILCNLFYNQFMYVTILLHCESSLKEKLTYSSLNP